MNLADMRKLLTMASSGEVQNFVQQFQAEVAELRADRVALKAAFPKGYVHFNQRLDAIETKLDDGLASINAKLNALLVVYTELEPNHGNHGKPNGSAGHAGNDAGTDLRSIGQPAI